MTPDFIILYVWIILHFVIGAKLTAKYFREHYAYDRDNFSNIHTEEQSQKEAAMVALFKFLFWPWIEAYLFVSRQLINRMTAEERKQKEIEAAYKIVAEHRAKQEREEQLREDARRKEFDRQLRGEA